MSRKQQPESVVYALNKPYGVLSQFTPDGSRNKPLRSLGLPPNIWPIGRLDADSEGLLLLASSASLTQRLLAPERAHPREYWVQVEGAPTEDALARLAGGLSIQGRQTRPCQVRLIDDPLLPPRDPPVRFRKSIPTRWLSLTLTEGRNRQVRRMTAAVGYPTLRLYRARVGAFFLTDLAPGAFRSLSRAEIAAVLTTPLHPPHEPAPLDAPAARKPGTRHLQGETPAVRRGP